MPKMPALHKTLEKIFPGGLIFVIIALKAATTGAWMRCSFVFIKQINIWHILKYGS
jgi:hypothetical protein